MLWREWLQERFWGKRLAGWGRAEQLVALGEEPTGLGLSAGFFSSRCSTQNTAFFGLVWAARKVSASELRPRWNLGRNFWGRCASPVINQVKHFLTFSTPQELFQPHKKELILFFFFLYTPSSPWPIGTTLESSIGSAQWYITSILVKQSICSMWLRGCFKNAILFRPTVAPHKVFCSHAFLWDDRAYPTALMVGACGFFPSSAECCSD